MADLAELGIVVNSQPMVEGSKAMDAMADAAARVEPKVTTAAKAVDALGEASARAGQRSQVSNGQMNDTAKILAAQAEQARMATQANAALGNSTTQMTLGQQLFVDKLRDQVAVLGMSRTQLLAYQAAELGVTAQTQELINKMQQFETAAKAAADASKKLADAKREQEKAAITLTGALQLLVAGYAALKAGEYIKEAALLAARYETLGVVIEVVGRNAGYTKTQMMTATQAIAAQGITMIESRESAVKLVQAHVDLKNATVLARIAQDAAVIGHLNSSDAFDRLVNGISRGNVLILRNIGINVNLQTAYREMAEELGKSTRELSENERVQARLNAVIARGADIAGTYEAAMGTASKQITSMQRYVQDLKTTFGEVFTEVLTVAVMGLTAGLKGANGEVTEMSKNDQLHEWGRSLTDIFVGVANAIDNILTGAKMAGTWAAHLSASGQIDSQFTEKFRATPEAERPALRKAWSQALADEQAAYEASQVALGAMADRFQSAYDARVAAQMAKRKADADAMLKVDAEYAKQATNILMDAATKGVAAQEVARRKVVELHRSIYVGTPTYRDTEGREPKPKVDQAENTRMADQLARIQDTVNAEKTMIDQLSKIDDLWHKAGLMGDEKFYKNKRDYATAAANEEIAGFSAQVAALRAHHSATAAETAKHQKQINDILGKKTVAEQKAANEVFLLDQQEMLRQKGIESASQDASNKHISGLSAENQKLEEANQGREISLASIAREEVARYDIAIAAQQQLMAEQALGGATDAELAQAPLILKYLQDIKAERERSATALGNRDDRNYHKKAAERAIQDWERAGNSIADSLSNAFGKGGKAIGQMFKAYSIGMAGQLRAERDLADAKKMSDDNPDKIAAVERAKVSRAQAELKSYGDMTEAAQSYFTEGSRGYQAMAAAAGVMRAAEVALSVVKGVNAVLTQATGDPYTAFARMAAMAAVVVGLGVALTGGGGSGGGQSAADMQKKQGAGGVFGDVDAQSESISRLLTLLEDHSGSLVPINRNMLTALRAIEAEMKGLTNLVVRTPGVTDASNMGIVTGKISQSKAPDGVGYLGYAGALTALVTKLWGKTTQSIVDSGIQFGGSVNALQAGQGYNQYASVDTTKSSWFGLSKKTTNSVQTQGLNDELSAQFGLVFTGLESALTAAAVGLGLGADHVRKTLDALTIDVTSISLKGLTGSALTEALNAVLSKAMDQMSEAVFPELDSFRQVGEGYSETVIRLASNYAKLDAALGSIGLAFGPTGIASLAARENLIGLAGGIDKFAEQTSSFAENFLTEAERLAPVRKYVAEELARMGLAGIETRDDFKAAVLGLSESGAIATAAGAQTFAGLMALEAAFAAVTEKAESAEDQLKRSNALLEVQGQIYEVTNDKVGAAVVLQKQHAAALEAMDESLRDVTQQLWDAQAAEKLREEALARANALLDIQAQIYALNGDKISAAAVLQAQHNAALEAMDPALRSATANLWGLQAAAASLAAVKADATVKTSNVESALAVVKGFVDQEKAALAEGNKAALKGIEDRIAAETKSVAKQKSLADALHSALDQMKDSVSLDLSRMRAQAQLQAALAIARAGGPLPDADGMKDALGTLTKDSSELFTTMEDWKRDFYRTQRDIADLSKITDDSLSVDERILASLESQKGSAQSMHESELARLDGILGSAQDQVNILNGKDTGMLTLAQAMEALKLAIIGAKANPIVGATAGIVDAYQTALGRQPDAPGLSYWQDRAAAGASQTDIVGAIKGSPEAMAQSLYRSVLGRDGDAAGISYWTKALSDGLSVESARDLFKQTDEYKKTKKVPGFDNGGDHTGGLRFVGERSIELEATGPSRIHSTRDLMSALRNPSSSNAELVAEIRRLNTTVERLQAAVDQTAANTGKTADSTVQMADQFDNLTEGGNVMRTEVVA